MERLIEDLEKDLQDIIEDRPLKKKREKLRDEANIRLCRMIIFSLLWASVGYQSALRFAGMKLGKSMGTKCKRTELSLVLEEIKKVIELLRAGSVDLKISPEGAQVRIFEGAISWGVPNILQNVCFFEEGFIEGYLDGVISKSGPLAVAGAKETIRELNVKERKCVGLGDEYCEFLIKF